MVSIGLQCLSDVHQGTGIDRLVGMLPRLHKYLYCGYGGRLTVDSLYLAQAAVRSVTLIVSSRLSFRCACRCLARNQMTSMFAHSGAVVTPHDAMSV